MFLWTTFYFPSGLQCFCFETKIRLRLFFFFYLCRFSNQCVAVWLKLVGWPLHIHSHSHHQNTQALASENLLIVHIRSLEHFYNDWDNLLRQHFMGFLSYFSYVKSHDHTWHWKWERSLSPSHTHALWFSATYSLVALPLLLLLWIPPNNTNIPHLPLISANVAAPMLKMLSHSHLIPLPGFGNRLPGRDPSPE